MNVSRRLAALGPLAAPLLLTIGGAGLLGFALAALLPLLAVPSLAAWLLLLGGVAALGYGLWRVSRLTVIPLNGSAPADDLILGFRRESPPSVAVLSGGPGLLVLSAVGAQVRRLTGIVPVQDPVEYYYRAAGLFTMQNVYYVVPTPAPMQVMARLDDGIEMDVRHLALDLSIAERYVRDLRLVRQNDDEAHLTRLAAEAIRDADAIILGPGSLFESILPNLLLDELREAVVQSKARKLYVCNLMTEPGRTTGFGVADHIRAIRQFGGFTPDFVLVNAQRIDPEVSRLYAAAQQSPVYLEPEEVEETTILAGDRSSQRRLVVEGATVIEADLASSVIQYTASLSNPTESRAVRVLRHDSQKLAATILELLRRT
jgi:hypothetical protein